MATESRSLAARPPTRATMSTRPGEPEARAGLAVDGGRHEARRGERRRRQRDRIREQVGDVRAELLVEHPDDDPDRRVELGRRRAPCSGCARSSSPVRTIDRGGLDLGLAQDARQARVADHQPGTDLGQVLLGVGRRPDPDDDLVARSQLVDRPEAEVVETADDCVTGGRHPRSLRGGDRPGSALRPGRLRSARRSVGLAPRRRALVVVRFVRTSTRGPPERRRLAGFPSPRHRPRPSRPHRGPPPGPRPARRRRPARPPASADRPACRGPRPSRRPSRPR